jgi:hypothetical protein
VNDIRVKIILFLVVKMSDIKEYKFQHRLVVQKYKILTEMYLTF